MAAFFGALLLAVFFGALRLATFFLAAFFGALRLATFFLAAFFFGALRLAAFFLATFFFGALRLAAFFLATFFFAVFFFAVLRAGDFLLFVVRAAARVFFSGSVSVVAPGSSADVVCSDIANLVVNVCSVRVSIIGSSSFESEPIHCACLHETKIDTEID